MAPNTPFKTLNTPNTQVHPNADGEPYSLDINPVAVDGAVGGIDTGQWRDLSYMIGRGG